MPKHREKLEDKILYVICEENCFRIPMLQCEKVSDLTSTQEEEDTRTLLHALRAANAGYNAVVITTDDTDILILYLGFNNDIPCPIYKKKKRNTDLHTVLCC